MRPSRRAAGVALLCVALCARGAAAQESATAQGRRHFDRAVGLFEAGDAGGALAEFQRAYELSGRSSVLYNIGASYQALHDYPRAVDALRRFVDAADGRPGALRDLALRALRQMEPLVAQLRLVREPADATVTVDGAAVEGDRVTVAAGPHAVSATAPGREGRRVELTLAAGDDRELTLALAPVAAPTPVTAAVVAPPVAVRVPAPPYRPPPDAPPDRRPFWTVTIATGGLTVGAIVAGSLAVATQHDYAARHVDDPEAPGIASRGRALSLTADLLGLGAVATGVAALVLGVRAGSHHAARSVSALVVPAMGVPSLTVVGVF